MIGACEFANLIIMKIAIPKEVHAGEKRVATTPDVIEKIKKLGFTISVEAGAGEASNISDAEYQADRKSVV